MDWLAGHGIAFGTSGIRGPAAQFDSDTCLALMRGFLGLAGTAQGPVLIGHDLRETSPSIAGYCLAAARTAGKPVQFAGAIPSPALAFASSLSGSAAVMVTGSHVDAGRNGLKFFIAGREITKEEELALATRAEPCTGRADALRPEPDASAATAYVQRYRRVFRPDCLAGLKLGIFEHSSTTRDLLHEILSSLGAETFGFGRSETFVPVDTEALPEFLIDEAHVQARMRRLDAIISADADGDRPLISDETGEWLRGDRLGLIAALAAGAATVVTPLTSSKAIEMTGKFENIVRTRIGSPYVIAGMQRQPEPVIGFEGNGGFILGSPLPLDGGMLAALPTRDAMLPLLLVLREMKRSGLSLSALSDRLPQWHSESGRIAGVPAEASLRLIEALRNDTARASSVLAPDDGSIAEVNSMDGLRCCFRSGTVVHLRASGNAPELRCYAEGPTREASRQLAADCLHRVGLLVMPEGRARG